MSQQDNNGKVYHNDSLEKLKKHTQIQWNSRKNLLAPQSGALRISAYRDFQTHTQSTYSFRAFKPFYSDQKQCM